MLLYREDEWIVGRCESMFLDGLDDINESDLGRKRVTVIDDWLVVAAVPAIHCVCFCVCVCVCVC